MIEYKRLRRIFCGETILYAADLHNRTMIVEHGSNTPMEALLRTTLDTFKLNYLIAQTLWTFIKKGVGTNSEVRLTMEITRELKMVCIAFTFIFQ